MQVLIIVFIVMVLLNPYLFIPLQTVLVSLKGRWLPKQKRTPLKSFELLKLKEVFDYGQIKSTKASNKKIMMMVTSQLTGVFYAVKKEQDESVT